MLLHIDTATGLRRSAVRYPDGRPPTPSGCRWCGIPQRHHGRRWAGKEYHSFAAPTQKQTKARMRARRAARAVRTTLTTAAE